MFELALNKQQLLTPLLMVAGAVDKKPANPILSNILIKCTADRLILTATDLDIEMTAFIDCVAAQGTGVITVSTKKIIDIIRSLDDAADLKMVFDDQIMTLSSGRSQFKLATLSADDFPVSTDLPNQMEFHLEKDGFLSLLQSTSFCISQNDVRVFLNGLLLEIDSEGITTVATDGHRLALGRSVFSSGSASSRLLIPRKSIFEIIKLLQVVDDQSILITVNSHQFKLNAAHYIFSSKLINASFPSYHAAIPKAHDKEIIIDRDLLKRALSRIIILSHEKSRAVLMDIQAQLLTLIASNHEQEEAVETLEAETKGEPLKIGVNANYLLDVLNHMPEGLVSISLSQPDASILIQSQQIQNYQYIIMPMKL